MGQFKPKKVKYDKVREEGRGGRSTGGGKKSSRAKKVGETMGAEERHKRR